MLQAVAMAHHGVAMAAGVEVCGVDGSMRVDRHGDEIAQVSFHECCCPSVAAAPPPGPLPVAAACPNEVPGAPRAAACPGGPWLAPLSRGPPSP
jgi:hypothetical protein